MDAFPDFAKTTVIQHAGSPAQAPIDRLDRILLLLPRTREQGRWPQFPYHDTLQTRWRRARRAGAKGVLVTDLPNTRGTRAVLAAVAAQAHTFELLSQGRALAAHTAAGAVERLGVYAVGLPPDLAGRAIEAAVAALLAAHAPRPSLRSGARRAPAPMTIHVYGAGRRLDFTRTLAEAQGTGLARWLTALPGNELTPRRYRRHLTTLARRHGWRVETLDTRALARRGAGAFLAVAQGSPEPDAALVRLRYLPPRRRRGTLALIGKGICFDTGGTNLKSARHMYGMHGDMGGSAVALGTLVALTRLRVEFAVDCWLALAENHIGPRAYKPNDVVRAANGVTIEVVHTDAEGRMVLADALALAARTRPSLMIDYATLTGSCIQAVGTRMSGICTNHDALTPVLMASGRESGERVWPFPIEPDYDEALSSEIADVKQCTLDNDADHILAARFLTRFVPSDLPWVHLDLAAAHHKGGLAHVPTDVTGFGVRYTLQLLLGHGLPAR